MNGKIHFLNTGHSDCIVIESDGHFAMVDAGEDNDFPENKPHLKAKGYEDEIIAYLLKNCTNTDGRVSLDFVLGTHAHSDHIGGFDTIINHPLVDVKKAYLKPYNENEVFIMELKRWDNTEVYMQMLNALKKNNVEIVEDLSNVSFSLGKLNITLLNGEQRNRKIKFGENINSIVTLIESGNTRAVLAGDLNYKGGDERKLAKLIGKVNLLKVGHHGLFGSTSINWIKTLKPEISVIPNFIKNVYPDVLFKLKKIAKSEIYCTADKNGVIAELYDNGKIEIKANIM
ncbi:MAG: MBL fold metallo-hydrolase [Oscillospiraceae bacterium]